MSDHAAPAAKVTAPNAVVPQPAVGAYPATAIEPIIQLAVGGAGVPIVPVALRSTNEAMPVVVMA